MTTSHKGLTALLATAVILAASAMLPQPAFASYNAQIGEDMGKCMQKFTGTQSFKDKMCACKDSACAQKATGGQVVWNRPTATDEGAGSTGHFAH